jgi:hypothetical protein
MEKSINTGDIHLQTTTKTNNDLLTEIIFDVKTNWKDWHLWDEDDYISLDESKDISDTHYIKICMQVGDEIFRMMYLSFDKHWTQTLRHCEAIDNEEYNPNADKENIAEALKEIKERVDVLLQKTQYLCK